MSYLKDILCIYPDYPHSTHTHTHTRTHTHTLRERRGLTFLTVGPGEAVHTAALLPRPAVLTGTPVSAGAGRTRPLQPGTPGERDIGPQSERERERERQRERDLESQSQRARDIESQTY